jgi:hypothetical protein
MTTVYLRKLYNSFVPANQASADAMEAMKPNQEFKAEITQPRNYQFHKKFFSLIEAAYEAWDGPVIEHKGELVRKNRDRFRKDITIMCGYYELVVNLKHELRKEAKSISFAKMSQEEFEELYSTAIDVILGHVLAGSGYTEEELRKQVDLILGFC